MTRSKAKTINLSMPADFIKLMDEWVRRTDRTRSEFVREAIRHYISILKLKGAV